MTPPILFLADMFLHMVAGMVADMGAGMVADKVAGMVADKKNLFLTLLLSLFALIQSSTYRTEPGNAFV